MVKCVVFDFDGTLVDTLKDLCYSINEALKENNYPVSYSLEETKSLIGSGIRNLCKRAIKPFTSSEEEVDELLCSFQKIYSLNKTRYSKPFYGIDYLLKWLNENKIKCAILSNKKDEYTKEIASKLLDISLFSAIQGKEENIPLKPDPTSLNLLLEKLKVSKKDVIYIGDSDVDMLTAKNGGVKSIGVLWGYRTRKDLEKYSPDFICSSIEEIIKIIKND